MRTVSQRVSKAAISIDGVPSANIKEGLVILLGIEADDSIDDITWLVNKLVNQRIFPDDAGVMNKSLLDIKGDTLIVSQFTLYASTKKGNRPSYIKSAKPEISESLYENFVDAFKAAVSDLKVATGKFGAHMEISLVNDGPVTIIMDSKNKE